MSHFDTKSFGSGPEAQESEYVNKSLQLNGLLRKVTFTKSGKTVDTDENFTLLNCPRLGI